MLEESASNGNMLPLFKEIGEPDFRRALANARGLRDFVLLESSLPMDGIGRYTFFTFDPFLVLEHRNGLTTAAIPGSKPRVFGNSPFETLDGMLLEYASAAAPDLPPFQCGAAGWLSYDLGRTVEKIPCVAADDAGYADMRLCFYDATAAFDHVSGRAWVVSSGLPEKDHAAARRAAARLELFLELTRSPGPEAGMFRITGPVRSSRSRREYVEAVRRCRQYIVEGDIFQVNLSRRFEAPFEGDPFAFYSKLMEASPAPFSAFVRAPDAVVVSSSPERFLMLRGSRAQTRPIKGTRPRGRDRAEDLRFAEELLGSEKDRAENTMIVDLLRNDFGRVCRPGTVRVTELCGLEKFPNVLHLTSTVTGELARGKRAAALLEACFPGGSITGAPKVRAMEIIEELEPHRRGVYTGAIGYFGFDGSMDLNIAIRTAVVASGKLRFSAGGGIVYDSDPDDEFEETSHKARGLLDALGVREESH